MIQVQPNIARPWIRGGGATVQGVCLTDSFKPFRVMQDDGEFGAYAIMCDGTVRFIKTTIPDELFRAMVTYKAGDSTAGIDEHAPKAELNTAGCGAGLDAARRRRPRSTCPRTGSRSASASTVHRSAWPCRRAGTIRQPTETRKRRSPASGRRRT